MSRVDFKTLVIGVLLGIIVMMARGAGVETAFVPRYQIAPLALQPGEVYPQILILDQKTNRVYDWRGGSIDANSAPLFEIKTPDSEKQ